MDEPLAQVVHLSMRRTIEEEVATFGLAIPAAMGGTVKGVSGVQSGTLVPGDKALVVLKIGPGGGKRYGFKEVSERGLTRVSDDCPRPYTHKSVLAIATNPNWRSAWIDRKDGRVDAYVFADERGVHRMFPDLKPGEQIRTQPWPGISAAASPEEREFVEIFGLSDATTTATTTTASPNRDEVVYATASGEAHPEPTAPVGAPLTADDLANGLAALKARFGGR